MFKHIVVYSTVGLLVLLVLPIPDSWSIDIPHIDKLEHFLLFGYITYVFSRIVPLWAAAFFALLLGVSTECVQYFLPYREGSLMDVVADALGVFSAVVILNLFSSKLK